MNRLKLFCALVPLGFAFSSQLAVALSDEELLHTEKGVISPRLADCSLKVDKEVLKPVRTQAPWRDEHRVGDLHITVEGDTVTSFQGSDGLKKWSTRTRDNRLAYWLGADGTTAYIGGYRLEGKWKTEVLDNPPVIRRLDLQSGKWLAEFAISAEGKPGAAEKETTLSVLARDKQTFVLTVIVRTVNGDEQLVGYRVTRFGRGEAKPQWAKKFASAGARTRPGAFLLYSASPPNQASSTIQHLAWLGDALLVCAGDVQDIVCLDRRTGEKRWWFQQIWNEDRGFVGPSVWQHVLGAQGDQGARRIGGGKSWRKWLPETRNQPGWEAVLSSAAQSLFPFLRATGTQRPTASS